MEGINEEDVVPETRRVSMPGHPFAVFIFLYHTFTADPTLVWGYEVNGVFVTYCSCIHFFNTFGSDPEKGAVLPAGITRIAVWREVHVCQ